MIYFDLFYTFFKIGLFTFGGGYAMIPLIQSEVVSKGWMTTSEMVDFIAVSESTPGPFAVNISTYIGSETAGFWGAVCATVGNVMPTFLIIILIARFYNRLMKTNIFSSMMSSLKACVVGLIAAAVLTIASETFIPSGAMNFLALAVSLGIFAVMMLLLKTKLHPIILILMSAAIGIGAGYLGVWG